MYQPYPSLIKSEQALAMLKSGNERFANGNLSDKSDYASEREALSQDQYPFAIVLTCSDSRVSPEIFFDQKLGDIFTIRIAGNLANTVTIGSIEFAVKYLKVPLVVVAGHRNCAAVIAAFQNAQLGGQLQGIINTIRPVCENCQDEDEAIHANTLRAVNEIKANDVVIKCNAAVVGAYYDIKTGVVSWL